jgi:hypothetical protein
MANLKDINTVPELEALEGTEKVILNVEGSAKQASVNLIKPAVEWDIDMNIVIECDEDGNQTPTYTMNTINTYENIKNKILNGEVVNCKGVVKEQSYFDRPFAVEVVNRMYVTYYPAEVDHPDAILFELDGRLLELPPFMLTSDDHVEMLF